VIVVSTDDFEVYHDVVGELRDRDVAFTTCEPDDELPEDASVVVTDSAHAESFAVPTVVATAGEPRAAVERALATLRGGTGRTIIGVDPGQKPGIAVLAGDIVVSAFQVPLADAVATIERETADATDPVVRVGDGSRLEGTRLVNDLSGVRVELVDETGTTPSLGTGARGMGDVLAAVNIARLDGERLERRDVDLTDGEIQVIKDRSREQSDTNRAIDEGLARRVGVGDLTIAEALAEHDETADTDGNDIS
jgi:hypothetical protein